MSFTRTMAPEELLSEIKPWDPESWRRFVRDFVIPIRVLAEVIEKNFVGDPSSSIVSRVKSEASAVIEVSSRVLGSIEHSYKPPEDPLEAVRDLVERSANTFPGVDEGGLYTLFVWTLRKVTREFFREMYSKMAKAETERISEVLGLRELFKPPVRSPLTESLTILGFHDYPFVARIKGYGTTVTMVTMPARERTLGGSICRLVDALATLLYRPGILSSVELSIKDLVKGYLDKAKQLAPIPPSLIYSSGSWPLGVSWRTFSQDPLTLSSVYVGVIEGFGVKVVSSYYEDGKYGDVRQETNLVTMLRLISPSLALGVADMIVSDDGRLMLLIERTV